MGFENALCESVLFDFYTVPHVLFIKQTKSTSNRVEYSPVGIRKSQKSLKHRENSYYFYYK